MNPLLLLLLALIACGDKDTGHVDTDTDADVQAMALVTTVAGDASLGSFATVALGDWSTRDALFVTSGDPVVVADEGYVFQINRFGYDVVRRYEAGSWDEPVWEQAVGDLSNPHDADICNGDLFVTMYGRDFVGVYDPSSGLLEGTVDLSAFSDGDATGPEASQLVELGGKLYVGMNRMNRDDGWVSEGGMVAEIDCASMAVTGSWSVGGNTRLHAWPDSGRLLVTAEAYGDDVAGLYAIDPSADTVTLIAASGDLGFTSVAAAGDAAIVLGLASDYSHYSILCVDLSSGAVVEGAQTTSYLNGAYVSAAGEAWITAGSSWLDPSAPSGIFVYDIEACEAVSSDPIRLSLYPTSVAFY